MTPDEHTLIDRFESPSTRFSSPEFTDRVLNRVQRHRRRRRVRDRAVRSALALCLLGSAGLVARQRGWFESPAPRVASANAGVAWLARTQQADGGWDAESWGGHPEFSPGVSALATLALLHAPDPADPSAVEAAADYLERTLQIHTTGEYTGPGFYNHLLALNTLLEIDSRRPDTDRRARLREALHTLVRHQHADGGWGYIGESPLAYGAADRDLSNSAVTWWVCRLLRRGRHLRLPGAEHALEQGEDWLAQRFRSRENIEYRPGGSHRAGPDDALYWMAAEQLADIDPSSPRNTYIPDAYRDVFRMRALAGHAPLESVYRGQDEGGAWNRPADRWWAAGGKVYVTAASVLSLVPKGV